MTLMAMLESCIFQVSGWLLVLFPLALLGWMVHDCLAASSKQDDLTCAEVNDKPKMSAKCLSTSFRAFFCAVGGLVTAMNVTVSTPLNFAAMRATRGVQKALSRPPVEDTTMSSCPQPTSGPGTAALCGATMAAAATAFQCRRRGGSAARALQTSTTTSWKPWSVQPQVARVVGGPQPSLWHDVSLFVKDWLDTPSGLLRYVNEMPMGGLKKFEVQPDVPHNAIREDCKGSQKLAAFGRPVPFNYGCFPQTFRDPEKVCELYGAPGDDDPLDVLDLSDACVGVGSIVTCRPLGAVCLIDEGQADWKILAVNTNAPGPLSNAKSIEDVERLAPGRVQQCLQWIDDFKKSSGKDVATLHWEIHDAKCAMALIEGDHTSWKELVADSDADGIARGHWIRSREAQAVSLRLPPAVAVPGKMLRAPSCMTGVARVPVLARAARSSASVFPLSRRHEPGHSA